MEIQKTSVLLVTSSGPKSLSGPLSQLKLGSSLNAVVEAKLAENSFLLKLSGGLLLRAQSQNALELGQILKLEVVKEGALPELKIIVPERGLQPEQAAVIQALRQFLPRKQSLTDFAVLLRQIAAVTTGKSDAVSAAIQNSLAALLSKDDLLSAEGLKRGLSNSGVFLEAKLSNQQMPLQGDLKGHLLTLANALEKFQGSHNMSSAKTIHPTTSQTSDFSSAKTALDVFSEAMADELLNKTEGAIARIVLDQLESLPQNGGKQNVWRAEIPITDDHHTDSVKLKINRESSANQTDNQANWSVVLELNPPRLGTLHARISLVDDVIDTYIWSDQQATMALVRDHLDQLSASYTQAGLVVGKLNALEGTPVKVEPSGSLLMPALLDARV